MKQQFLALFSVATVALAAAPAAHAGDDSSVIVNRTPLAAEQVSALRAYYGQIAPGAYWYDATSGLWGSEGGPALGQIAPGLSLGGPLQADASNGEGGVFFNGRQLHPSEVEWLRARFGVVYTGRYWLRADGVGGPEGGPALFSLVAAGHGSGGGGASNNDFYYGGTIDRGYGGTYGSDGSCFYISTDAGSVLGGGC
jgi:hypothetical protein